jgi:hypothetical protein
MGAHGDRFGTAQQLQDPLTNARGALTIYNERGGGERGLRAWGAYTDGRYARWLAESRAAFNSFGGSISGAASQWLGAYGDQATSGHVALFCLGLGGLLLFRHLRG